MRAEVGAAGVHPAARLPGAVQFIVGWPLAGMDSKTQRDGLPADTDRTLASYL